MEKVKGTSKSCRFDFIRRGFPLHYTYYPLVLSHDFQKLGKFMF